MKWWARRSLPVKVLLTLIVSAVVALELHLWLVGYEGDTSTAAIAELGYILFPIYGLLVALGVLAAERAARR